MKKIYKILLAPVVVCLVVITITVLMWGVGKLSFIMNILLYWILFTTIKIITKLIV